MERVPLEVETRQDAGKVVDVRSHPFRKLATLRITFLEGLADSLGVFLICNCDTHIRGQRVQCRLVTEGSSLRSSSWMDVLKLPSVEARVHPSGYSSLNLPKRSSPLS